MDIPEREVVRLWLKQLERRRTSITTDGQSLDVLYPGRPSDSPGGDFRDAAVLVGDAVRHGCIEIHIRTSGWETHGHHLDPHYNCVVLHVVLQQDSNGKTRLENGSIIPTLVLDKDLISIEHGEELPLPCIRAHTPNLGECLEKLGEIRLSNKVERFRMDIQTTDPEQALYAGLLEALGYSKNKKPFLALARHAPVQNFKFLAGEGSDLLSVQSRLLGLSGLLPSQRGLDQTSNDYLLELENGWRESLLGQAMSFSEWDLFKVRPCNYPVRRIIALSDLILRFRRRGWLEGRRRVLGNLMVRNSKVDLCTLLLVRSNGYWSSHYDFCLPQSTRRSWLLGRERAAEITINVILPFFIAWSKLRGENAFASALNNIYRKHPLCETNSIHKHMLGQLKTGKALVNSCLRQQGLLHLYKAYCTQARCVECLLIE
jgi:hypothetical protein